MECKNRGDTSNNRGDWDYFKVIQKIREQYSGKTGFSLQQLAAPNLQHTTNREQNNGCGNSTAQSQAPDDGYINVRNMLSA